MGRRGAHYSPPRRHYDARKPTHPDEHPQYRRKPSNGPRRASDKTPINPLKSKIRGLTRSLDHNENMPAGVRIEQERALAGYKQDLENAENEKRKQALISRYHMVRFFERRKASRHVKKARKDLEACEPNTPEHAAAVRNIHIAEVDLNYTLYCPLDQKYEGIYPREANDRNNKATTERQGSGKGKDTEDAQTPGPRPAMWKIVENCMENGTLEALRNGKLNTTFAVGNKKRASAKAHARGPGGGVMVDFGTNPEPTRPRAAQDQDSSDESDGGFFEKRGRWKIDPP